MRCTAGWRRRIRGAGIFSLLCACAVTALSADVELATGTLLVADRKLTDPNFQKAIVLVVNYGDQGTLGLIVNHPTDVPVSQLLPGKDTRDRKDTAFSGGPVEPKSVLALLRTNKGPEGAQRIVGDVWVVLDQDVLADTLKSHPGPDKLRLFVGYAGWGEGQLETEMEAGAWRVIRATSATVFDPSPESVWDRVVRGLDLTLASVRPQPAFFFFRPSSSMPAISRP